LAKEKLVDYDGAIADFNEALHISSEALALDSRARVELKVGRYESALDDYTHLINLFPQPQCKVNYYHCRALAKQHLKDKIGAADDFEKEKHLRAELKYR